MADMIERVARAILDAENDDCNASLSDEEWARIVRNRGTVANLRVDWIWHAAERAIATVAAHDAEVIASLNADLVEVRAALRTAEEDVGIARKAYCAMEAERDRLAEEVADRNGEIYRLHSELAHTKIHADRLWGALKLAEPILAQEFSGYGPDEPETRALNAVRAALEAANG